MLHRTLSNLPERGLIKYVLWFHAIIFSEGFLPPKSTYHRVDITESFSRAFNPQKISWWLHGSTKNDFVSGIDCLSNIWPKYIFKVFFINLNVFAHTVTIVTLASILYQIFPNWPGNLAEDPSVLFSVLLITITHVSLAYAISILPTSKGN